MMDNLTFFKTSNLNGTVVNTEYKEKEFRPRCSRPELPLFHDVITTKINNNIEIYKLSE